MNAPKETEKLESPHRDASPPRDADHDSTPAPSPSRFQVRQVDQPFPLWFKELLAFTVTILMLAGMFYSLKSDNRSTREAFDSFVETQKERDGERRATEKSQADNMVRLTNEIVALRQTLLLHEARFQSLEKTQAEFKSSLEVNSMLDQRTREGMLKRGMLE